MHTKAKAILIETTWVFALLAIAIACSRFMFSSWVNYNLTDPSFKPTDHISMQWKIAGPLFLLLTFIAFFIKGLKNSFAEKIINIIAIVSGLMLIISLMIISNLWLHLELFLFGGWTSYPPLSALSDDHSNPVGKVIPAIQRLSFLLMAVQIGVTICLLFIVYSWGSKNRVN